jgi:hypothetical protein
MDSLVAYLRGFRNIISLRSRVEKQGIYACNTNTRHKVLEATFCHERYVENNDVVVEKSNRD